MSHLILALNAGSSSVKFGVYETDASGGPRAVARGTLETGARPRLRAKAPDGTALCDEAMPGRSLTAGIESLLRWIEEAFPGRSLAACGHRIVLGGGAFADPVRLTPPVIEAIDRLTPLAPLHQPRSVAPIRAVAELRPDLPQVGCFDTAFHRTIEPPASRFALPRAYEAKGIRRFGFHGLSYEYVVGWLGAEGKAGMKTVIAHLGNGASLCAIRDGRSLDTTMGFSALDGLVMGTRCGAIDPGVLLYLLREEGMTPDELQDLLYRKSGLLGRHARAGGERGPARP
jgi:acetate kinase